MSLPAERQAAMRATLGEIYDPQERMAVAVGWKNGLGVLLDEERTDGNIVRGCVSRVWLVGEVREGRCWYRVDADSVVVRGLVGLMCGIYNGATAEEVVAEEPVVLEELGLLRNLTLTRQNGMAAVREAVAAFARRAVG